jgi:hypothetical protein
MRNVAAILAVLLAGGSIVFGQVPLATSTFWQTTEQNIYSTGMIWRDCNNDGYIDVFFANGNDMARARNSIYLSRLGTMPTIASWSSTNAEYSGHGAVGDIDDNGYPDFVVANYLGAGRFGTQNRANLYFNYRGLPDYSPNWYSGDTMYSFSSALGDVDGDGDLDLAMATGDGYYSQKQKARVYYNIDGALESLPAWQSDLVGEALDVTWGDVDNDGDLDLALCHNDVPTRLYYNQGGTLETTPSWVANNSESANTLIFGDINGDGWLDLIVAFNNQLGGSGYYMVYYNDGTGYLNPTPGWRSADGGYGSALALYDYDNDGDEDLAAGRWFDRPRIYENLGDSLTSNPVWRADNSTVPEELAWVDIDADGIEGFADTVLANGKKLFYTKHHPLYSIDSVMVDGNILPIADYCFDLVSGWVSLADIPQDNIIIYYEYSYKNDLTVANWDTYNMAYGNTNNPFLRFSADTTTGFAPFTVNFTDNTVGISDRLWRLGDGATAIEAAPVHIYQDGGTYDVYMEGRLSGQFHNHTHKKMIIAFADTLYFPKINVTSATTIKIPVYLRNTHPLRSIILPIYFGGEFQLEYVGYDLDSCRTDYFESIVQVNYSSYAQKMVFRFDPNIAGDNPDLAPGNGRLINLYFTISSGRGINALDSTTMSNKSLALDANYITYKTAVKQGKITYRPYKKGDADHSGKINLLDVSSIINFLYRGGPDPGLYEGDADSNGKINLLDVAYIINYLYRGGPPPVD